MAGANETPRNKLIALMYLVFITMLALNVSKEVLDGFGQMFKKIQSANERVNTSCAKFSFLSCSPKILRSLSCAKSNTFVRISSWVSKCIS